ncbi:zeta toxin family protein [Streptomyces sp. RK75]|uniref:zeta toxin family protein n=1 Tax=Streptomyces sp. RK75 TaxID=2824895 RepID=UPI0027DC38A0|nr:zeta toxin family protein [Streptomyces sp. RK75]
MGTEKGPGQEWWQSVLAQQILPSCTREAVRQDDPVVVFVAGQPGSGKTQLACLLQAVLSRRGGAVRIGRDLYKALHPRYADFLAEDVRTAGLRVRPETSGWQEAVEEYVRRCGFDAVVETALADPVHFRSTAAAYRAAGFRREVVALAVAEAVSQYSLLDRFLGEALKEDGGRYVGWGNHDACATGMLRSLAAIEAELLAERITVVRRDLTVLYSNELAEDGTTWRRPPASDRTAARERARPWSARETWTFRRGLLVTDRRLHRELHDEDRRLAVQRDSERAAALAEPVRRIAQPKAEPPGVDYHRLSADEHQWVFENLVLPGLGPVIAQERPLVVYVVGQPGAGKTAVADLVQRSLPGSARIASDDFKAAHPDYLTLLQEDPRGAGAAIRADYTAWQRAAEAHVRTQRGHMVVEAAPADAQEFLARIAEDHAAGYGVEVVAIAARPADSRQGTAQRYATALQDGVPARFTTKAGHDRCDQGVTEVIRAAETHPAIGSLLVISRAGDTLWRQTKPLAKRASWAFTAERHRPYTEDEARRFLARHRRLRLALPQHRDELEDIAALARPLLPARMAPRAVIAGAREPVALPLPAPSREAGRAGDEEAGVFFLGRGRPAEVYDSVSSW